MDSKTPVWLLLIVAPIVGIVDGRVRAETIAVSVPRLTGQYFDADRVLDVDGSALHSQVDVPVAWLSEFESIDKLRIRVSGSMTPSRWRLRRLDSTLTRRFTKVGTPEDEIAVPMPTEIIEEWTELPGLWFMLHPVGVWTRGLTTSVRISRDSTASGDEVPFDYELGFDKFFIPNLDDAASEFHRLHFSRGVRFWTADLSPTPLQTEIGIIDIQDAQLIVEGTLRAGSKLPEPGSMALLAVGLGLLAGCRLPARR